MSLRIEIKLKLELKSGKKEIPKSWKPEVACVGRAVVKTLNQYFIWLLFAFLWPKRGSEDKEELSVCYCLPEMLIFDVFCLFIYFCVVFETDH